MGKKYHRIPKTVRIDDNRTEDRGNNVKADGANLGIGNSEYREYIRDKKGMDEFEQEKDKLAKAGLYQADEKKPYSKWHKERSEFLSTEKQLQRLERERTRNGRLSDSERKVSHEIKKSLLYDQVLDRAMDKALKTPTLKDDYYVANIKPIELEDEIYNDGISLDDFSK